MFHVKNKENVGEKAKENGSNSVSQFLHSTSLSSTLPYWNLSGMAIMFVRWLDAKKVMKATC